MKKYNIAIAGATGNVGRELVKLLAEEKLPIERLYLLASNRSVGKTINFANQDIKVEDLEDFNFSKVDIACFTVSKELSKKFAPLATKHGAIVIDKSEAFRLNDDVPLIMPGVNNKEIKNYKKTNIIATPNCCVAPLSIVLNAVYKLSPVKRVIVSTYQSTSGAGREAMEELYNQTKAKLSFQDIETKIFSKQISFNIIPQIGEFKESKFTDEEEKIFLETAKILNDKKIQINATSVRVPTFIGHCLSVNIEMANSFGSISRIIDSIKKSDKTEILESNDYHTPIDTVSNNKVYISRIRNDYTRKNSFNCWVVSDNLYIGAVSNTVDIIKDLIKSYI